MEAFVCFHCLEAYGLTQMVVFIDLSDRSSLLDVKSGEWGRSKAASASEQESGIGLNHLACLGLVSIFEVKLNFT